MKFFRRASLRRPAVLAVCALAFMLLSGASAPVEARGIPYAPATLTVTNADDDGPGSLRQTIAEAADGDTIVFDISGGGCGCGSDVGDTIFVDTGELVIDKNLTIIGPTDRGLAITADGNSRVILVAPGVSLSLSNVVIADGAAFDGLGGGGILNYGDLTLSHVLVINNVTDGEGGGINSEGTSLTIFNSTIAENAAFMNGGGLLNCDETTALLVNVTIIDNAADISGSGSWFGGGIGQVSSNPITLRNTIVAYNFNGFTNDYDDVFVYDDLVDDAFDSVLDPASHHNLIGVDIGFTVTPGVTGIANGSNGNIIGTFAEPADPLLDFVDFNGSPLLTAQPQQGSPVLDAGDNAAAIAAGLTTDQRGFPRILDSGDADEIQTVDMGAFEARASVGIADEITIPEDTVGQVVPFNVGDINSIFGVTVQSHDPLLIPNDEANLLLTAGPGGSRTLTITPAANAFGTAHIDITVDADEFGDESFTATLTINIEPVVDVPDVTPAFTSVGVPTTSGLVITPNAADGAEVTHFKITAITGGTLYQADGSTPIVNDQFIDVAEGALGLKFTPAGGFAGTATFQVQGAFDNLGGGLGPAATATISVTDPSTTTVVSANPNPSDQTQPIPVFYTVVSSGGPTPSGNVTVSISGGTETCTGTVAAGQCTLTPTVAGVRDITATYAGDSVTAGSVSGPFAHTVDSCSIDPIVTSTADSGAGSLRDTIAATCHGNLVTFNIAPATDITLTSGVLQLNKNIVITGFGADVRLNGNHASRIFVVNAGVTAALDRLTLFNGRSSGDHSGAILNQGTLAITNSTLTNNDATTSGGAIGNLGGTLTIANSTVAFNTAGIDGGGIWTGGGAVTIRNSTISENTAAFFGGGIQSNSATSLTLTHVTVTLNSAGPGGDVGGVGYSGATTIGNSIIAGNFAPTVPNIVPGFVTVGANLTSGDPMLDPLANNGGPTRTHMPQAGSPALDAGDNAVAAGAGLTTDQRGAPFDRTRDAADANTTPAVDLGAVETDPVVEAIGGRSTNEDVPLAITLNVGDAAAPVDFDAIVATSNGTSVIPNAPANVALTGSGSTRTLTLTPVANLSGPSTITVTATKTIGGVLQTSSMQFILTVNSVNDPPTLDAIASPPAILEDAPQQTVNLTGITPGGGETQALTVTALSNNTGLIPNPTVTYTSPGATGSLAYTPVANASGTATITVTVTDAALGTAVQTFTITVTPVADTASITNASTFVNTQTTAGLVVSRNAADGVEVTHVQVTNITGGTLFQHDGVTAIGNGAFITIAEGAAGLRFTPAASSTATGHVTIQASTSALVAGLAGAAVTADILVGQPPSRPLLTGADAGGLPHVRRLMALDGGVPTGALSSFLPFDPSFAGGVRVAEGDLNGDGVSDYVAGSGPGGAPVVAIVDGASGGLRTAFAAFETTFTGGVFVAAGDVNGDGYVDVIAGTGAGHSGEVKVFSGRDLSILASTPVSGPEFTSGVHVAAGDVDGDGLADLVLGSGSGGTTVTVLSGADLSVLHTFSAYPGFTGGVFVGAGDVTGDGYADIVTGAGPGGGPHVKVFDGRTGATTNNFFAFEPSFGGGVRVAAGDVNGDGHAEIIVGAGPGGTADIRVFDPVTTTLLSSFLAYTPAFTGGVFVATAVPVSQMVIDAPAPGAVLRSTFTISGWAFEEGTGNVGIAGIDVTAIPVGGGAPIALGAATIGDPRGDIGALYGAQYANAGFHLAISGLAPGVYDLRVTARGAVSGVANLVRTVRVAVVPDPVPLLAIDIPAPGRVPGGDFAVAGWALTPDTAPAPGVDAVHVWAAPADGGPWKFLGSATLGVPRPDVAAVFGPEFGLSGYYLIVTGLEAGAWDLHVFPRATGKAAFAAARVVRVVVPGGAPRSFMTGADAGGGPHVRRFSALDGTPPTVGSLTSFFPFDPAFTGGVRVAEGDVNGDGVPDYIASTGPGVAPLVRVIDGALGTVIHGFEAFETSFTGGVFVAAGDVNGDGYADVIAGSGEGRRAEVKVFNGRDASLIRDVFVFDPSFTGGVHVGAGDVNGDGYADLVAGAGAGGSDVMVLNAIDLSLLWTVTPYGGFAGGVFVAAGDVTGDGFADVVTGAGAGGGPHVRVFDGRTGVEARSFYAYEDGFGGGVRVAAGDVNDDGHAEIIAGSGPGRAAEARVFDGVTGVLLTNVIAYAPTFGGGLFVATAAPVNRMAIEAPADGATVHGPFQLTGWAFDEHPWSAGLDAIHVWAFPVAGGLPTFGGLATLRDPRPDVAAIYGGQYARAGFHVDITGLAPGVYDVVAFGRSRVSGTFNVQRVVRITVTP